MTSTIARDPGPRALTTRPPLKRGNVIATIRLALLLLVLALVPATSFGATGILLLAHGGSAEWNNHVTALAAEVNRTVPTEVALGMATRATIQVGIDRLVARGVTEVAAVPLFVSSWSSIITSTEYLLGLRAVAPRALALYAKMNHSPSAAPTPQLLPGEFRAISANVAPYMR